MSTPATFTDPIAALRDIEAKLTVLLCERTLDSTRPEFYQVREARDIARDAVKSAELAGACGKPTSGAWTIESTTDGFHIVATNEHERTEIAFLPTHALVTSDQLANARLMTASPEMAATLRMVIKWAAEVPAPYREFPFVVSTRAVLTKIPPVSS